MMMLAKLTYMALQIRLVAALRDRDRLIQYVRTIANGNDVGGTAGNLLRELGIGL
jgi:hypothetical protein